MAAHTAPSTTGRTFGRMLGVTSAAAIPVAAVITVLVVGLGPVAAAQPAPDPTPSATPSSSTTASPSPDPTTSPAPGDSPSPTPSSSSGLLPGVLPTLPNILPDQSPPVCVPGVGCIVGSPSPTASSGGNGTLPAGFSAPGGPGDCAPAHYEPDTWGVVSGSVVVPGTTPTAQRDYGSIGRTDMTVRLTVDPFLPCRMFRLGTAAKNFADRNVVQRSTDGGDSWTDVLDGPAKFRAADVYVPAPGVVYVADDGNGTAVLRSNDGGTTWVAANGGLAGQLVLYLSPNHDGHTVYAYASPCAPGSTVTGCNIADGPASLYVTTDSGNNWQQFGTTIPAPFTIAADPSPARPGHVLVLVRSEGEGNAEIFASHDYGRSFGTTQSVSAEPHDPGDLYGVVLANGSTRFVVQALDNFISDDDFAHETKVDGYYKTIVDTPFRPARTDSGLVASLADLAFGNYYDDQVRVVFSRDGMNHLDVGSPMPRYLLGPDPMSDYSVFSPAIGYGQIAAGDTIYATVAYACQGNQSWHGPSEYCQPDTYKGGDAKAPARIRFATIRYTLPAAGHRILGALDAAAAKSTCTGPCQLITRAAPCTIGGAPTGNPNSTSLAFDGAELLYSPGITGPADNQALIERVDPTTCKALGTIVVPLDPDDYQRAVGVSVRDHFTTKPTGELSTTHPVIDRLAYDSNHRRLLFSLAMNGAAADTNSGDPASLWSVGLGNPQPSGARDIVGAAHLFVTGSHCTAETAGQADQSGMEAVGYDRSSDLVWGCTHAAPVRFDSNGDETAHLNPCWESNPTFRGAGYGTDQEAFTVGEPGQVFFLAGDQSGTPLIQYDVDNCQPVNSYSGLSLPGNHTSMGVACDPITYGPGGALMDASTAVAGGVGVPVTGNPLSVLWTRLGDQLTPYAFADPTNKCRFPVTLAYTGPAAIKEADGPSPVCATMTIDGPDTGAGGQRVAIKVDGGELATVTTDRQGRACAPPTGLPAGSHRLDFTFAGNTAFYAASTVGLLSVTIPDLPPPPLVVPPIVPPPAVVPPAPVPVAVPVPAVVVVPLPALRPALEMARAPAEQPPPPPEAQPANPPQQPVNQGQTQQVSQTASQAATAAERERQVQLAYAEQSGDTESPDYALAALTHRSGQGVLAGAGATTTLVVLAGLALGLRSARRRAPSASVAVVRRTGSGRR